jgi:predicted RNA-binding Zn-ribbon protein involved in translation (DUF1610 family)
MKIIMNAKSIQIQLATSHKDDKTTYSLWVEGEVSDIDKRSLSSVKARSLLAIEATKEEALRLLSEAEFNRLVEETKKTECVCTRPPTGKESGVTKARCSLIDELVAYSPDKEAVFEMVEEGSEQELDLRLLRAVSNTCRTLRGDLSEALDVIDRLRLQNEVLTTALLTEREQKTSRDIEEIIRGSKRVELAVCPDHGPVSYVVERPIGSFCGKCNKPVVWPHGKPREQRATTEAGAAMGKKVKQRGVDFPCEECGKEEGSKLDNGFYRCKNCGYPGQ